MDISQKISRKARVKAQVRPPTFLSSTFRLFFFSWVIFYCLPQAFFFLSRHSRKLSSTYRKITPSCPGLSRGKSVSHRSYRRILEASNSQRSAQAHPPPPKATLTESLDSIQLPSFSSPDLLRVIAKKY
jgi:hypothetical protein